MSAALLVSSNPLRFDNQRRGQTLSNVHCRAKLSLADNRLKFSYSFKTVNKTFLGGGGLILIILGIGITTSLQLNNLLHNIFGNRLIHKKAKETELENWNLVEVLLLNSQRSQAVPSPV